MQAQELHPDDFTAERFAPVFEHVAQESGRPFNANHFFPNWRRLMDIGIARTWAVGDSVVLGGIFTPDLFNSDKRAQVVFWFSLPSARHTQAAGAVFKIFEQVARASGCIDIQSAAHEKLQPEWRGRGYLKHGFMKSETIYAKSLEVQVE